MFLSHERLLRRATHHSVDSSRYGTMLASIKMQIAFQDQQNVKENSSPGPRKEPRDAKAYVSRRYASVGLTQPDL